MAGQVVQSGADQNLKRAGALGEVSEHRACTRPDIVSYKISNPVGTAETAQWAVT